MQNTILTVDDSNSVRLLIAITLRQSGYRVLEADSGAEALELLKRECVDMVISDLIMPDMDGIELTRKISNLQADRKVPVIILTTDLQKSRLEEAKEAGAIGWMIKPFTAGDLEVVVRKVLEKTARAASGSHD